MLSACTHFIRKLGLSYVHLTRTNWSYTRVKVNQPNCFIPRYLLDGSYRKGHKKSGRNESGHVTTRHKRGPGRKNCRIVDFLRVSYLKEHRNKMFKDQVVGIAFDPCRSAMLAKVIGDSSENYRLILAATGMKIGDIILKSRREPPQEYVFKAGDTFPIKFMPKNDFVFNIETQPGGGGKMARCGDSSMMISSKFVDKGKIHVKLLKNTREVIIDGDCLASYGSAMTNRLKYLPLGKAGRARRYGKGRGGKTGILRLRNRRQKGRKNLLTFKRKK